MGFDLKQLSEVVQFNCDVADANFAGNYTMCTYLLKMRELYRWSESIDQSDKLSTDAVSDWVEQKEEYWSSLEDAEYKLLPLGDSVLDPFDVQEINQELESSDLVYGAGYGRGCRPEFYLGALAKAENYESYNLLISDHEYARDLSAPVAMSQGDRIYIRQESIRRMLWEQIETWRWRRSPDGALSKALQFYPLASDQAASLEQLVNLQMEQVIHHEIGEVAAGKQLGDEWRNMLMSHPGTKLEMLARAIKDHLADSMVTLPVLIDDGEPAAIHLYFSNLNAMRQMLFPQLVTAYEQWCDTSSLDRFKRMIGPSHVHWLSQAWELLDGFRQHGDAFIISDADIATCQPVFHLH